MSRLPLKVVTCDQLIREFGMTLCLAAIAHDSAGTPTLVALSDHMITFGDGHWEEMAERVSLKSDPIHKNWLCLFASDDVTEVPFILERLRNAVYEKPQLSLTEVQDALSKSLAQRLHDVINATVLAPYNKTVDDFLRAETAKTFVPYLYAAICKKIDAVALKTELLVFGFDGDGEPHIITQESKQAPKNHDLVGFACIGGGAVPAIEKIIERVKTNKLNQNVPYAAWILHLMEAKIAGEAEPGVGKESFLYVFEKDKRIQYIEEDSHDMNDLRAICTKVHSPTLPSQEDMERIALMPKTMDVLRPNLKL